MAYYLKKMELKTITDMNHKYYRHPKQAKFTYSEKATKFCKIPTVDLTGTRQDKSTVQILRNFVALSEYMYERY